MSAARGLALLLASALAACASSPKTQFFALSETKAPAIATLAVPVQLTAVHLPPMLDRTQMVRLAGDNQVRIDDTDRWAAPIDDMVRNVLARDLALRIAPSKFVPPESPAPPGTVTLVVTIGQFAADRDGVVQISGEWSALSSASRLPLEQRPFAFHESSADDPGAIARAMSDTLGRLADAMTRDLAQLGSGAHAWSGSNPPRIAP